jgi:hypothetical protein
MAAHEASFTMYNPFKDGSIILELTNQLYHDVFDSPEHPLIAKVLYSKKKIFHANIYFRSKVSSRKQKDLHHDIVANIAFYIGPSSCIILYLAVSRKTFNCSDEFQSSNTSAKRKKSRSVHGSKSFRDFSYCRLGSLLLCIAQKCAMAVNKRPTLVLQAFDHDLEGAALFYKENLFHPIKPNDLHITSLGDDVKEFFHASTDLVWLLCDIPLYSNHPMLTTFTDNGLDEFKRISQKSLSLFVTMNIEIKSRFKYLENLFLMVKDDFDVKLFESGEKMKEQILNRTILNVGDLQNILERNGVCYEFLPIEDDDNNRNWNTISYLLYGNTSHGFHVRQIIFFHLYLIVQILGMHLDKEEIPNFDYDLFKELALDAIEAMERMEDSMEEDNFEKLKLYKKEDGYSPESFTPKMIHNILSNVCTSQFRDWYDAGLLEFQMIATIFNLKFHSVFLSFRSSQMIKDGEIEFKLGKKAYTRNTKLWTINSFLI